MHIFIIDFLPGFQWNQQRGMLYQTHPDEDMAGAAREARQRLDDKFRAQRMSDNKRYTKENQEQKGFFFYADLIIFLEEAESYKSIA